MSNPARRLSAVITKLQQAAAASDRVYEILDRQPEIGEPRTPKPMPKLQHALRFDNVRFHYTSDKPVLKRIDLNVRAGETIAIVGLNGCGKSTLLNLVPRFYDPIEGAITIDGVDLRDLRVGDLRSRIGLVSQESLMLNETVALNIAYGSPAATQQDIERAARQAHAYEFITQKLSDGFQTVVGPGGNKLSGGQRQRIALARVILRDPHILILDEATSQIDLESEQLIHRVLEEFMRDRTALVVTHRVTTTALADRIVVMENGQISHVGTHAELLELSDLYRRLTSIGYGKSA
jgi:subfamily B ATP-binding cassette protein MsbA